MIVFKNWAVLSYYFFHIYSKLTKNLFIMNYILTTVSAILIVANVFSQSPQVIETSPLSQTIINDPHAPILITFDQPINEVTVNSNTFRVFGRWSGPMDGIISFNINSTGVEFTPIRDFFYGEWVTVRLTSGIQNMEGLPLTNGYGFNYWTKSLPASLDLVFGEQINMRLPGEGAITLYGAYAGDINNDEFSDLVVITEDSNDIRVLFNDGLNSFDPFIIIEMPNGQGPSTNEGADFNHDGLIDMAIGSTYSDNVSVLMGNVTTIFDEEVNYQTGMGVRGLAILGMLIVVVGVGSFLKLAVDEGWIAAIHPATRCGASALFGLALLSTGEFFRRKINPLASSGV